MIHFVDLGRQYVSIKDEVDQAVSNIIGKTSFILGAPVANFERDFAAYCGVEYCIGVGNGTDALTLALAAIGIGQGDEVILPANTFIATALAVSHVGATVVPVDVDPKTNLMTAELVSQRITERTAAIIPVHLFGKPVEMQPLLDLAQRHGLAVLEDACQAHGAVYQERRAGSFGSAAAFSFYPGKNLGGYGDGGAIVTNDGAIAQQARLLRDLGQERKYVHTVKGFNSRLDALQAAILSAKLPHLDAWNARRSEVAAEYDAAFARADIRTNSESSGTSVQHLYCVRIDDRDAVIKELEAAGIGYGIHYPTPIHLHAAYSDLGYAPGDFPVAEAWSKQTLSLPIYAELTGPEVQKVIDIVCAAIKSTAALYA